MNHDKQFFSERRIVITGLGTINPLANDVSSYWAGLKNGKSVIRSLQNTDLSNYHVSIGGEVDYPDNIRSYFKKPKMIKRLDRNIVFSHVAGVQALRDSELDIESVADRCGAILGTGAGGIRAHQITSDYIHDGQPYNVSPFYVISSIPSTSTSYFVTESGLKGPIFSVNSACATGNHAFGLSSMLIKANLADVMFAGGTEAAVNALGITAFGAIGALSTRNDEPQSASRPFDRDRDGFTMGEGAGVLCLEELNHAKSRGAKIYGELTGFGFTSDASDYVAPHPEAEGSVRAIEAALDMAGLQPSDIGLINAHGTATPLGDEIEYLGISKVFKEYSASIPVHSTKSITGHLLGAASAVEAIAALMVFSEGVVHATANHEILDPKIELNVVKENLDGSGIDHILSNAFGFGGMNACVILSRYEE